jgi:hypothetical protein
MPVAATVGRIARPRRHRADDPPTRRAQDHALVTLRRGLSENLADNTAPDGPTTDTADGREGTGPGTGLWPATTVTGMSHRYRAADRARTGSGPVPGNGDTGAPNRYRYASVQPDSSSTAALSNRRKDRRRPPATNSGPSHPE